MRITADNVMMNREDWLKIGFDTGWIKTAGAKEMEFAFNKRKEAVKSLLNEGNLEEAVRVVGLMKTHLMQVPSYAFETMSRHEAFMNKWFDEVMFLNKRVEREKHGGKNAVWMTDQNKYVNRNDLPGGATQKIER